MLGDTPKGVFYTTPKRKSSPDDDSADWEHEDVD